jgi:thiamine biosynthesis lipoprotein
MCKMRKDGNRKYILIAATLVFVLAVYLAFNLMYKSKGYEDRFFSLGTYVHIKISGTSKAKDAVLQAEKIINNVYYKYNPNLKGSLIYDINNQKTTKIDSEAYRLFELSKYINSKTDGAFDITLGNLSRLWGFRDDIYPLTSMPSPSAVKKAKLATGFDKFIIYPDRVENNGVKIDLGGIAKGYAAQEAANYIKKNYPSAWGYIDAGGDIYLIGDKNGKDPWKIGVADPDSPSKSATTLLINGNIGVVTSGDYERYYMIGKYRVCHIMNPETGYPADKVRSVTVIGTNTEILDALATAVFVDPSIAKKVCDQFKVKILIINKDEKILLYNWNQTFK